MPSVRSFVELVAAAHQSINQIFSQSVTCVRKLVATCLIRGDTMAMARVERLVYGASRHDSKEWLQHHTTQMNVRNILSRISAQLDT